MKKYIALAMLNLILFTTAHGQLSGVNISQLTNLMSPSKMMNMMPNQNQSDLLGLDKNVMKMLQGSQENEQQKQVQDFLDPAFKVPGQIAPPKAGDATPKYYNSEGEYNPYEQIHEQSTQIRSLQDSIGFMSSKVDSFTAKYNSMYVWGHEMFSNELLKTFMKSSDAKVSDSYVINIDDELTLAVWGYADYNETFKVNNEGYIQIPEFGRVYVKGLTFGAVKSLIAKRLGTFINPKNTKFEVTVNYVRSIGINILGEVKYPGTYQIPAINSVFNALNASQGPTFNGSIRNIEVRRDGKFLKRFDVYDYLLNKNSDYNFYLQENDVIYVPIIGKVVEISGAVRKQNKYEMKKDEGLNKLIEFAGGLYVNAYTDYIKLERFVGQKTEVININLTEILESGSDFEIQDGDKFYIPKSEVKSDESIEISGEVLIPGTYQYKDNYRVSDLIKIAGGMLPTTYMDRAYVTREMDDGSKVLMKISLKDLFMDENAADNILLKKKDKLELFTKKSFIEKFRVSITGSVRKPVKVDYAEGLTLNDLIFYAGGLKKEAANNKIEISRVINVKDSDDRIYEAQRAVVQTIEIGPNLELDNFSKNYELSPMDQVFVRRHIDFKEQMNVSIKGEVMYPGTYPILSKDETIIDLIERAGGLTPYAHINSARLFRKDSVNAIEILDLKAAYSDTTSYANYALLDADVIEVPLMNPMVSVRGALRYPEADTNRFISGTYKPGKRLRYYINNYGGGYAPRARKKATMVIHPNGDVDRTKSFIGIKRYPKAREGSQIITYYKPPKPETEPVPKQPLNWNLVLPSIIISLSTVASTMIIVQLMKN